MQIRIVRFESKNPLVGIALLAVALAILAFILTAGMALLAGAAAIGSAGYLVRRVFGGKSLGAPRLPDERVLRPSDEVFPSVTSSAVRHLPPESPDNRSPGDSAKTGRLT